MLAQIAAAAARHAHRTTLSSGQEQAAVSELIEAAASRSDLLAQYAGLAVGFHEGDYDEPLYLRAAQLCISAGADISLIPRWIDEGRRRAGAGAHHRRAAELLRIRAQRVRWSALPRGRDDRRRTVVAVSDIGWQTARLG